MDEAFITDLGDVKKRLLRRKRDHFVLNCRKIFFVLIDFIYLLIFYNSRKKFMTNNYSFNIKKT